MPIPSSVTRAYSYSAWQAANPVAPLPADRIETDLDNLSNFTKGARASLAEQLVLIESLQIALPPEGSSAVAAANSAAAALASQGAAANSAAAALASQSAAATSAAAALASKIATDAALAAATVAGTASNLTPQTNGVAAPGISLQFSRADHVHSATNAVAAGVRFINASFLVDQLGNAAGVAVATGGAVHFPVDLWYGQRSNGGAFTLSRSYDADFVAGSFLNAAVTTGGAYGGAGDYAFPFAYNIEGIDFTDLGWGTAKAKPVTLTFEMESNVAGSYAVAFRNSALNRAYIAVFSYAVANTKQRITITVPGDVTGTWLTTAGAVGLRVALLTLGGTTYHVGAAGAWTASAGFAVAGLVNWAASASNFVRISGPQISKGGVAGPFIQQSAAAALLECQRYYQLHVFTNYLNGGGTSAVSIVLPAIPCKTPALATQSLGESGLISAAITYSGRQTIYSVITAGTSAYLTALYTVDARI